MIEYLVYPVKDKLDSTEWQGSTKVICIVNAETEDDALNVAISCARDCAPGGVGIPNESLRDHFRAEAFTDQNKNSLISKLGLLASAKSELLEKKCIQWHKTQDVK